MQPTEVKDVRLAAESRAGKRRFRLIMFFVLLAMHACIPFNLPSAAGLENETSSLMPTSGCEELVIPMCRNLHLYNRTKFPNSLGHRGQDDAGLEIHQYYPLVKVNCSDSLGYFLCTVYAPPCSDFLDVALPPCRSLCLRAQNGCLRLMNQFGFEWPESLDCSRFPESDLCIGEDPSQETSPPSPVYEETTPDNLIPPRFRATGANDHVTTPPQHVGCQAVTVPLCRGLEYTETMSPNLLGHAIQEQAEREMTQFAPFVRVNCSPYLRFFLCTAFVPPCNSALLSPLPPCRSLCLESQRGCQPLFDRIGLHWPDFLECSKFPVSGLCVGKEAFLELKILAINECESKIAKDEAGHSVLNQPELYSTPFKMFVVILFQIILTKLW